MSNVEFKKDMKDIADKILCGVDYDIYKEDCNEMDNELRDEIEYRLVNEFGVIDEMYKMLEMLSGQLTDINAHHAAKEIDELLAKARGEK